MSKRPGRPRRGELADLGIYPGDDCYDPPPKTDCDVIPMSIDLDDGHRLGITRYYRRGTSVLTYFGVHQSVLVDETWFPVARIDCSHGMVHRHQFTRNGSNR